MGQGEGVSLCLAFVKQDDEFVVNYCLKAQWITYETTQEMLNYAKTRVSYIFLFFFSRKICIDLT